MESICQFHALMIEIDYSRNYLDFFSLKSNAQSHETNIHFKLKETVSVGRISRERY